MDLTELARAKGRSLTYLAGLKWTRQRGMRHMGDSTT
jgi:hypothetical protein